MSRVSSLSSDGSVLIIYSKLTWLWIDVIVQCGSNWHVCLEAHVEVSTKSWLEEHEVDNISVANEIDAIDSVEKIITKKFLRCFIVPMLF
jgi:hypothetical protein